MQRAKDTFYITVRDRIASLNPARTVLVRGVLRPGVLTEESELAVAYQPANAFRLQWTALSVNAEAAMPLVKMVCEIHYSTAGNSGNGGMDRGRLMAAMDAELAGAVNAAPQSAAKMDYAAAFVPAPMQTKIFWSNVFFDDLTVNGEQLERVAKVDVYSYQEAGEL
jgi:hypothetical protein